MLGTSTNLCRRDVLQDLVLLGEHLFACFVKSEHIAGLVVENYSKSLQHLEVGIVLVYLVTGVILQVQKRVCNIGVRLPKKQELVSHHKKNGK